MYIPAEKLESLSGIGVFRPNGLNDDTRIDLTSGEPFLAVDTPRPEEIDDAIRVRHHRAGGYLIEVAIADAAQIHGRDELLEEAFRVGSNDYSRPWLPRILPPSVIRELELAKGRRNRALIVRQAIDSSLEPVGDIDILPAFVSTNTMTFSQLARALACGAHAPLRRLSEELGIIPQGSLNEMPVGRDAYDLGSNVIQERMVHANLLMTAWSEQRELSVIRRIYTRNRPENPATFARFSVNSGTHDGIRANASIPYAGGTSPLRRTDHLLNHIQIGTYQADGTGAYDSEQLTSFVERMNQHALTIKPPRHLGQAV